MKTKTKLFILILLLCISIFLAFFMDQQGSLQILGRLFTGQMTAADSTILFKLRLPRILAGVIVGAAVSLGAVTLQTLTKNDLAETGILGVNAGAGLIMVLGIFFFGTIVLSPIYAMILSFIGAGITVFFIFVINRKQATQRKLNMLLTGVALNIGFNAFILVLSLKLPYETYREFYTWMLGSVATSNMLQVYLGMPLLLIVGCLIWRYHVELNILDSGESMGINLGISVQQLQNFLFLAVTILAALSVSIGGNVLFLGLLASHFSKTLISHNHKYLIPASACMGAFFFVVADLLGKILLAPREVPVGLVISAIGVPLFLFFFIKENMKQ